MKVYTIQINYKSGVSMTADFTELTLDHETWSWTVVNPSLIKPVLLNPDAIESVWQLSVREEQDPA